MSHKRDSASVASMTHESMKKFSSNGLPIAWDGKDWTYYKWVMLGCGGCGHRPL
jgi:hypothetical protein